MDFDLTTEQKSIFDTARAFAIEKLAPKAVEWDQTKHFPTDVIRELADLGMCGMFVREEHGGAGLSRLDGTLVYEALSYGCPTIAAFVSIHNMCAWMIDSFGSDEQRARWLPELVNAQCFASYCLTEPGSGSDAAALATRAAEEDEDLVLTGSKSFISGGGVSDLYIVMARTGEAGPSGISAILVEKGAPGLSFGAQEKKMGWNAQPTAMVLLDQCRVPLGNLLGGFGRGFSYAMQALDGGRLNIAACSLGAAQAAFDKTIDQFQALQFRLADMETGLQTARCLLRQAAAKLDAKSPDATRFCAMAKCFVTDTGFAVANDALQLHGGYGYLADYGIEKIVRDLRVHQILEGTNEIMRHVIARDLLAGHPS
jgi:alkylation response protein AidB-like acyl-CoA dehydrogenase